MTERNSIGCPNVAAARCPDCGYSYAGGNMAHDCRTDHLRPDNAVGEPATYIGNENHNVPVLKYGAEIVPAHWPTGGGYVHIRVGEHQLFGPSHKYGCLEWGKYSSNGGSYLKDDALAALSAAPPPPGYTDKTVIPQASTPACCVQHLCPQCHKINDRGPGQACEACLFSNQVGWAVRKVHGVGFGNDEPHRETGLVPSRPLKLPPDTGVMLRASLLALKLEPIVRENAKGIAEYLAMAVVKGDGV